MTPLNRARRDPLNGSTGGTGAGVRPPEDRQGPFPGRNRKKGFTRVRAGEVRTVPLAWSVRSVSAPEGPQEYWFLGFFRVLLSSLGRHPGWVPSSPHPNGPGGPRARVRPTEDNEPLSPRVVLRDLNDLPLPPDLFWGGVLC